ncbi:MAG: hypothetical protein DWQ31_03180 [Planctomycetota bacterium]|nr:MAG: hypothetical protein DWQ31_03180 [Planctomycetota bacterium]REJ90005.1 MAG: hypothetical protein DWQ35_17470 [Planctomycetota bacterium]
MKSQVACVAVVVACLSLIAGSAGAGEARVEIEVLLTGRTSPTAPQEWMRVLEEAGFERAQIRQARGNERIGVTIVRREPSPHYRVIGQLLRSGRLQLSANEAFGRNERNELQAWVESLKEHGPDGPPEVGAFGLTADQFAAVKEELATPVAATTRGLRPADVVRQIAAALDAPLRIERTAREALAEAPDVPDEFQGFAGGTALAAVLRPAGLAIYPDVQEDTTRYVVTVRRRGVEVWPIGWEEDTKAIPALFEFEKIEQAVRLPMVDAMQDLTSRLAAPVLWDHAGIARRGIEIGEIEVELKAANRHLASYLRRVLQQGGLGFEVRQDDAGRAFLWIKPGRRAARRGRATDR